MSQSLKLTDVACLATIQGTYAITFENISIRHVAACLMRLKT